MICEANTKAQEVYRSRKASKRCVSCNHPVGDTGTARCETCRKIAADYRKEKASARRAAGRCLDCDRAAVPGRAKCQACLTKHQLCDARGGRRAWNPCECCRIANSVVGGSHCGDCCRLMALDALRKKLHSRCENAGTLDYELEPADRAEFEKLTQVRETKPEPVELPVYSLRAIADVARMTH